MITERELTMYLCVYACVCVCVCWYRWRGRFGGYQTILIWRRFIMPSTSATSRCLCSRLSVCLSVCLSDSLCFSTSHFKCSTGNWHTGKRRTLAVVQLSLEALCADYRFVFQQLPEPNRACLVGVYAVTLDPLLSLYGIICDLVYKPPTKTYRSQIPAAFGIPGHVTTKDLPDTPC